MKKILILLMLIMNTACANTEVEVRIIKNHEKIHKEFEPYVKEFIYMSKGKVSEGDFKRFTMGFRDYPNEVSTVGTCHPIAYEVDISKDWWNNNHSASARLELVFHEFGHCILKRGHTHKPIHSGFAAWLERLGFDIGIFEEKGYLYDRCPASFMHPYTLNEECINKHFYYYIEELFDREKNINYVEYRKLSREPQSKRSCKLPKVINKTKTWNSKDQATLDRASATCVKRYRSCLKTFWKKAEDNYAALCR